MPETILAKLRQEHREIQNILERIEANNNTERKKELFDEVKSLLVPHMEGEEKTIYAHLRNDVQDETAEAIAEEADFEHHEIRDCMQRLTLLEIDNENWMKEFHSFKEHVNQHVREEETELFDEAKEDFSREELVFFAEEFEEAKHHLSI